MITRIRAPLGAALLTTLVASFSGCRTPESSTAGTAFRTAGDTAVRAGDAPAYFLLPSVRRALGVGDSSLFQISGSPSESGGWIVELKRVDPATIEPTVLPEDQWGDVRVVGEVEKSCAERPRAVDKPYKGEPICYEVMGMTSLTIPSAVKSIFAGPGPAGNRFVIVRRPPVVDPR